MLHKKMISKPTVRVKTSIKPLHCPTCGDPVEDISLHSTEVYDGGIRAYKSKSKKCGHYFTIIVQ